MSLVFPSISIFGMVAGLGKIRRVLSEQPGKQASKRYLMQRTRANIKQLTTCLGFLEEEGEVLPVENSRRLRNEWRLVG